MAAFVLSFSSLMRSWYSASSIALAPRVSALSESSESFSGWGGLLLKEAVGALVDY